MCGIFGFRIDKDIFGENEIRSLLKDLFIFSESRGKEASGLSIAVGNKLKVIKSPQSASQLIRRDDFKDLLDSLFKQDQRNQENDCYFAIGHSRLVTNGGQQINNNNQPVISDQIVAIHNGIITNVNDLWKSNPQLERKSQVDTEVFLRLFRSYLSAGLSIQKITQ